MAAGSIPPPEGVPAAYIAISGGAVTGSGSTLTIPAQTAAINGRPVVIAAQTLTVPLPSTSRTLISATAGVITYPNAIAYFGLIQFTITNNSGSAIASGQAISITACDEHQLSPSVGMDTVTTTASLANGASTTLVSNKFFGPGSGSGALSITLPVALQAAGVTVVATEYQFRGNLKINASGVQFAWDNRYVSGETKLCQFEVATTGITYVRDSRAIGPLPKAQRIGSEVVDWSAHTPEGPDTSIFNQSCIYAGCELIDGHILIGANSGLLSEHDGQSFSKTWRPSLLSSSEDVTALCCLGLNQNGQEIVFIGASSGKLIRWNRTADTYSLINTFTTIQRIIKAFGQYNVAVVGDSSLVLQVTETGSTATTASIGSNAPDNITTAGSEHMWDAAWYNRHLYVVGGGPSGSGSMRFWQFNALTNQSHELTPYLPGTQAERGATSSSTTVRMVSACMAEDGLLLLLGTSATGTYLAEWDTKRQFARGLLQFTVSGGQTIPAGTVVSNGTLQYETTERIVATGAGTFTIEGRALSGGYAGFAAYNTLTTLVTAGLTNVTAVTNITPFGLGRVVAGVSAAEYPPNIGAPIHISWTGRQAVITCQNGEVITYDHVRFTDRTRLFGFKGRATYGLRGTRGHWVLADEGHAFSMPH